MNDFLGSVLTNQISLVRQPYEHKNSTFFATSSGVAILSKGIEFKYLFPIVAGVYTPDIGSRLKR